MSIKDEILRSVVIHYITDETPIGSVQLQKEYDLAISSATIRNHFKKLVLEGMLEQLHSSSGRIPTRDALIAFWTHELNKTQKIKIENRRLLAKAAAAYNIFVFLHDESENRVLRVEPKGSYLLAELEEGLVAVPHTKAVERFLGEFVGLDMGDLVRISRQMGVHDLTQALLDYIRDHRFMKFNQQALIDIAANNRDWADEYFDSYYNGDIAFWLDKGVNVGGAVPEECIVGKQLCEMEGREYTLTFMGESSRDYRNFLSSIQGG